MALGVAIATVSGVGLDYKAFTQSIKDQSKYNQPLALSPKLPHALHRRHR